MCKFAISSYLYTILLVRRTIPGMNKFIKFEHLLYLLVHMNGCSIIIIHIKEFVILKLFSPNFWLHSCASTVKKL